MPAERVPGVGPTEATYAIVGEAPGATERREGKPFVGPSGQLLREGLERVGLDPEKAYITNVYKEYRSGNPTPTAAEIAGVRDELREELSALPNLKAVLLLGNTPLKAFTGFTGITKRRGRQETDLVGVPALATLHPAAVLRNVRYKSDWLNDLAGFAALVNEVEESIRVHIIQSILGVEAMKSDMVLHKGFGALDVETTVTKRIGDAQLVTVAVSFDGARAWVLTHEDPDVMMRGLRVLSEGRWVMHNGSFDLMMLHTHTPFRFELAADTMAMHYLLHPEEKKGLQVLSGVYLGLPPYKDVDYKNILEEPIKQVAEMNGRDAARTLMLYRPLADALNEHPHLSRTYQWLLRPAIQALVDITVRGVPVDRQRLDELRSELTVELEGVRKILQDLAGEPAPALAKTTGYDKEEWPGDGFNPASPQQVAHVLFDKLNLPVLSHTETGAPSTSAADLQQLAERTGNHFIQKLLEYRKAYKMLTAFVNSWDELADDKDFLHPRYKPTQVATGRLAAEAPNIQQVPRDSRFRRVFGGRDGLVWVKADLSQIELRIAAWIADEEAMIQAYQEGADLHALTAQRVFGVDDVTAEWKPGKTARDGGKMLNFSLLYGAYPSKLQEIARTQYGIDLGKREAEEARGLFFESYPRLAQYHADTQARVRARGQVESPLGRVRTFPEINDPDEWVVKRAEREAVNHPIQSFASDMVVSALVRLPEDVRQYTIAEIHDELDFLAPEAEVERIIPIIKATMEDVEWLKKWGINFHLPVVADVEAKGTHWSE